MSIFHKRYNVHITQNALKTNDQSPRPWTFLAFNNNLVRKRWRCHLLSLAIEGSELGRGCFCLWPQFPAPSFGGKLHSVYVLVTFLRQRFSIEFYAFYTQIDWSVLLFRSECAASPEVPESLFIYVILHNLVMLLFTHRWNIYNRA